jgi:hypothetical protein
MKEYKLKIYAPEGIENQIGLILAVSPLQGRKIDEVNFYLREGEKKSQLDKDLKTNFISKIAQHLVELISRY